MRKQAKQALLTVLLAGMLTLPIMAGYPASGQSVPNGSVLLEGEIIGEKIGWGGNPDVGAAAAFDGHRSTYYDPTTAGADYAYCGMEMEQKYILTKVCIHPREGQTSRFLGGSIQGSNDMENWYTLFESDYEASYSWQVITEFESNIGYKYFRYWNGVNHGDVGDIELYGYPGSNGNDPYDTSETEVRSEIHVSFDYRIPVENLQMDKIPSIVCEIGGTYPALPEPKWEGLVFDGWYSASGNRIETGDPVTRLADHFLYGKWLTAEEAELRDVQIPDETAETAEQSEQTVQTDEKSLYALPVPILIAAGVSAAAAVVVSIIKKDS